jgi:hypothetical protein
MSENVQVAPAHVKPMNLVQVVGLSLAAYILVALIFSSGSALITVAILCALLSIGVGISQIARVVSVFIAGFALLGWFMGLGNFNNDDSAEVISEIERATLIEKARKILTEDKKISEHDILWYSDTEPYKKEIVVVVNHLKETMFNCMKFEGIVGLSGPRSKPNDPVFYMTCTAIDRPYVNSYFKPTDAIALVMP